MGYGHEEFGYRLWDPMTKKIVRSRDVVFLEDQVTRDNNKAEEASSSTEIPSSFDATPPSMSHDHGGDTEEDNSDGVNNDEPIEHIEEEVTQTPVEQHLRRSNRERQSTIRYPSDEYLLLTDWGELETFQEVIGVKEQNEGLKAMYEEMQSLHENYTYDLVKLPQGKKSLKNK